MNPDELEQRLARVPLAEPPAAWRRQILEAARSARVADPVLPRGRASGGAPNGARPGTWWAGLVGAWASPWTVPAGAFVLVWLLHVGGSGLDRDGPPDLKGSMYSSRGQAVAVAREYQARVAAFARADEDGKDSEAARESSLHGPWPDAMSRPRSSVEPDGETGGRLGMPRMG